MIEFYVHYTVTMAPKSPQKCVAGPYKEHEVLDQRRDIAGYGGVTDVYIDEKPEA
jgi:hypothetical protein